MDISLYHKPQANQGRKKLIHVTVKSAGEGDIVTNQAKNTEVS